MNNNVQSSKPLCSLPWFQINIRYTGQIQPCCMMGAIGTLHDEELLSIWNGERYRTLRHKLASHDLKDTPCEFCTHRLLGSWQEFPDFALQDDVLRKSNYDRAFEHYCNGDTLLTSQPVSYRMDVTNECNLNCIMCDQNHDPRANRDRFPRFFIDHFFDAGYFSAAGEIVLVGGEPLFVDESIEIIKRAVKLGTGECQLNLQTNGLLIRKYWQEIKQFKNAYFAISIDGCTKSTYEKIRRGGDWNELLATLDIIQATAANDSWRSWNMYHAHVVMRSNLLELPRMLEFAHRYNAGAGFSPMYDTDNRKENIFLFNWLLEDIPVWKSLLDQSIEMASAPRFNALAQNSLILVCKLLLAEPWITREKETLIRQYAGIEGLRKIFHLKVRQCQYSSYQNSQDNVTFFPISHPAVKDSVSPAQHLYNTDVTGGEMVFSAPCNQQRDLKEVWATDLLATIAKYENRLYYRDQTVDSLMYLVDMVNAIKPDRIVELGTLSGLSLRTWQAAAPDTRITAIDLSFQPLLRSRQVLPLDLTHVTLLEQDILTIDFASLWKADERVILYIDAHDDSGVPIMEHLLTSALPALPAGSMVIVDDIWYSPEMLDRRSAEQFFKEVVINEIDPLQCFDGYYASYWKGGSFFGFMEVIPLLGWVNSNSIELDFRSGVKSVGFLIGSV